MRMPSLKKAQTFPTLDSLEIGFVPENDDDVTLPTTHVLRRDDCIYVLRRGQTERPEDMRRCDVFLVVEIRRENEEGAKAIAICHPLYRYDDERLTPELLGFPKKILGEGELVITNALAVVDPERIVSNTEIYRFDLVSETGAEIPHDYYWCRYKLNTKKKGSGPKISEFAGSVHAPGDDCSITLTCIDEAHSDGRVPYSPNLDGTAEIWCPYCTVWLHHRCCKSIGTGAERWVDGAPLAQNLGRAAILRGKWWGDGERSDWMLAGSGKYIIEYRGRNLPLDTPDAEVRKLFGNDTIISDYPQFDCEWFECPRCHKQI